MTLRSYTLDEAGMASTASRGMEAAINCLKEEAVLTPEQAREFLDSHTAVFLIEESLYTRIVRRVFPEKASPGKANTLVKVIKI